MGEGERGRAESPDRQARTVDGERRQHRVQAGTGGEPGVDQRGRAVEAETQRRDDALRESHDRGGVEIERYSHPEMARVWSMRNKFDKWLAVEVAVCEAWADEGAVPREALPAIRRGYVDPPQPMFRYNGERALGLAVSMTAGGDVLALGKALEEKSREIVAMTGAQPTHPGAESLFEELVPQIDKYAAEVDRVYTPVWSCMGGDPLTKYTDAKEKEREAAGKR